MLYGARGAVVGQYLQNLAVVQLRAGALVAGRANIERALPILEQQYGAEGGHTIAALDASAAIFVATRQPSQAISIYDRLVPMQVRASGEQSEWVMVMRHRAFLALAYAGQLDLARQRTLDLAEDCGRLGKGSMARLWSNLGIIERLAGRPHEALQWQQRALSAVREAPPAERERMQIRAEIGAALVDLGRHEHLTEALAGFESAGAVRWAGSARFLMALVYSELGQHARAHQFAAPELTDKPEASSARGFELRAALAQAAGVNPLAHHQQALAMLGDQPGSTLLNRREVALLGCARWSGPAAVPADFDEIVADAQKWDKGGILIAALALRAHADAKPETAADGARRALKLLEEFEPEGLYRAEVWAIAATVFTRASAHDEAERAVRDGARWIAATALSHVPEEFRDSFLNRNRVNLELRLAASRQPRLAR